MGDISKHNSHFEKQYSFGLFGRNLTPARPIHNTVKTSIGPLHLRNTNIAFSRRKLLCVCIKPVLNWTNVCSPNILRTLRLTMIRFLTELLVRRIWFGLSKLYFNLNWLVMRCKHRLELAADAQQTACSKK